MVCLGNICRSPLAEGILRSLVDPETVEVDSAGTAGYHIGNRPDERSIAVARKYGLDISGQRCRKFHSADFACFVRIYAMDLANLRHLQGMARSEEELNKVRLLLDEAMVETREVPDPYYGGPGGFAEVFELISRACHAISEQMESKNSGK